MVRADVVDGVVLDAVTKTLEPRVIDLAVDKAVQQLRATEDHQQDVRTGIINEMSLIDTRLSGLVQALVAGGSLDTLVEQIKAEEERKKLLAAKLEAIAGADILNELNDRTLKAELHRRVSDVQAVLGRHTPQARQMLRKLLDGQDPRRAPPRRPTEGVPVDGLPERGPPVARGRVPGAYANGVKPGGKN